ncbi:MAG: 3-deoxy-7-phosphoheptulonate synthase [Hyphomicrobiaceae bacterium]|nr:3-deoxy-7-phosphoheptulonate synthase [Hyphomicrobiaceae bacterium]
MSQTTDDVRIASIYPIPTPLDIMAETPRTDDVYDLVSFTRTRVHNILHHLDDRLIVIVGPCSIHDPAAATDYARRLMALREDLADDLEIIMRVYFEKPRTTVGWKGLINDPDLDGSFNITKGLKVARRLLHDINALGLPAGCEFLDMTTPQYIADLVSWGAIGARTTESQVHRELASGSSCAIGFKNGTSGDVKIAVDAVGAASHPHHFLAVTKSGEAAIAATRGNDDGHIILRGGTGGTNYDAESIDAACALLDKAGLPLSVMIDASHANSSKDHNRQPIVLGEVGRQIAGGDRRIIGVMIESNLAAGRQDLKLGTDLTYGQSITDACIDWAATEAALTRLADDVSRRRTA